MILPHFSPDQHFAYWQYGPTLGPNLGSALGHVVLHPLDTARLFFSPMIKTQTLLLFLVPVLFLALRSRYSILALPLLAQRFFEPAVRDNLWYPSFHYNALPWVIFVLAMIDGAARLGVWSRPRLSLAVLTVIARHSDRPDRRESAVLRAASRGTARDAERQGVQHDRAHASSAGRR